jgi:hypothetical protein
MVAELVNNTAAISDQGWPASSNRRMWDRSRAAESVSRR